MAGADQPKTMKAFVVGEDGKGSLVSDFPVPEPGEGEALVRVLRAGICNTDLELTRGYKGGYTGVLGHEFVGEVISAATAPELVGKRVCGELNINCSACGICARGGTLARNHCMNRRVLGILKHHGTYAEYLTLPVVNLHKVPDNLSTEAATFVEPLAAACRIVEQGLVQKGHKVCVLGGGKLGLLIAEVLARQALESKPVLIVRSPQGPLRQVDFGCLVDVRQTERGAPPPADLEGTFDVVVDATGSPEGLEAASKLVIAMGTIVLKSTCAEPATIDLAPFVVSELSIVGSRCGPFPEAIKLAAGDGLNLVKYVSAVFPLEEASAAMEMAQTKGCLKVQLAIAESELGAVGVRTRQ